MIIKVLASLSIVRVLCSLCSIEQIIF
jgi:hypothetical protein